MKDFAESFSTTHEAVKFAATVTPKPREGGKFYWHVVDSLTGKITAKSL